MEVHPLRGKVVSPSLNAINSVRTLPVIGSPLFVATGRRIVILHRRQEVSLPSYPDDRIASSDKNRSHCSAKSGR